MNYLRKFEDLDHLGYLKAEQELRKKADAFQDKETDRKRMELTGKHLDKLRADSAESKKDYLKERQEIVQNVIDGLTANLNNHPGYQSFRDELLDFLKGFPKE